MIDVMRKKTITLIIVLLILVGAATILWYGVPDLDLDGTWLGSSADDNGVNATSEKPGGTEQEDMTYDTDSENNIWYYIAARADRYEAFAALRPDLTFEDVVWRVNVDLDKEPYEDVRAAKDPMSILALVNKHFYLPEDFTPPDLVNIGKSMMRADAADAMNEMIRVADGEGHHLWVQSGFRSFNIQAQLYEQYSASDGYEEADRYSARPGHSEHQTGLVADLNTITAAFGETPEGKWAASNSWYFGYIVRYTADNTDVTLYKPEPWHLRYIGREAAAGMHDLGILSFEEYWVKYVNH